jgi:hypothetical protein
MLSHPPSPSDLIVTPHLLEEKISLNTHAAWAFENYYAYPYEERPDDKKQTVARIAHGIQHAARAAMYIPILVNLYRRYRDPDACKLTHGTLRLLQIAVLFHDAARKNEGIDFWDCHSATLIFSYLTKNLSIPFLVAKEIAEAAANKDTQNNEPFMELMLTTNNVITWIPGQSRSKTLLQKLIHDADCLDIIRARSHFDATYLDFYQCYAANPKLNTAFNEMAQLIIEARHLIEIQGDSYRQLNLSLKNKYEQRDAYRAQITTLRKTSHLKMMQALIGEEEGSLLDEKSLSIKLVDNISFNPAQPLRGENLWAAMHEGKALFRGIFTPAAIMEKTSSVDSKLDHPPESAAEREIRKMDREFGVPTRTKKIMTSLSKNGNLARSVSYCWGVRLYSMAGYIIPNLENKHIYSVSACDFNTGRGKKNPIIAQGTLPPAIVQQQIQELICSVKKGGASYHFNWQGYLPSHTEIISDIYECVAIVYSQDPCLANYIHNGDFYPTHPAAPLLEAIYLQKIYSRMIGQTPRTKNLPKVLPIYRYSAYQNNLIAEEFISNEKIISLWSELCGDFLQSRLKLNNFRNISDWLQGDRAALNQLKLLSLYKTTQAPTDNTIYNQPVDSCYDAALKNLVDAGIHAKLQEIMLQFNNQVLQKLIQNRSAFDDDIFFALLHFQELSKPPHIQKILLDCINQEYIREHLNPLKIKNMTGSLHYTREQLLNKPQIYSQIPLLKIYQLAQLLDPHLDVILITNAIRKLIINKIRQMLNKPHLTYKTNINKTIKKIHILIRLFDINKKIEEEVRLKIEEWLDLLLVHDANIQRWDFHYFVIETLKVTQLLSEQQLSQHITIYINHVEIILKTNIEARKDKFAFYLHLTKSFFECPNQRRDILLFCLNNTVYNFHPDWNIVSTLYIHELNDAEVFSALFKSFSSGIDADEVLTNLSNHVKDKLPRKEFSPWQRQVIDECRMQNVMKMHIEPFHRRIHKGYKKGIKPIRLYRYLHHLAKTTLTRERVANDIIHWMNAGDRLDDRCIDLLLSSSVFKNIFQHPAFFESFINRVCFLNRQTQTFCREDYELRLLKIREHFPGIAYAEIIRKKLDLVKDKPNALIAMLLYLHHRKSENKKVCDYHTRMRDFLFLLTYVSSLAPIINGPALSEFHHFGQKTQHLFGGFFKSHRYQTLRQSLFSLDAKELITTKLEYDSYCRNHPSATYILDEEKSSLAMK